MVISKVVSPRKSLDFYPMSLVLTERVYSLVPMQVTEAECFVAELRILFQI